MSEGNQKLVKAKEQGIEAVVNNLFATKTPKEFKKSRPGPGGLTLTYVEVGYVVSVLNNAFGPFWEWRVVDKQIGDKQIWVQGELTVKDKDGFSITKTGFGGATIKTSRDTGAKVSIANDLKAAGSDALKKSASLFGIAADVFYKEMDILEDSPEVISEEEDIDNFVIDQVRKKFFAISALKGYPAEKAKTFIKAKYKVEHMEELTVEQLEESIANLEAFYQDVQPGEEPLKVGEFRKKPVEEEEVISPASSEESQLPKSCGLDGCDKEAGISGFCSKEHQDQYWPPKKKTRLGVARA